MMTAMEDVFLPGGYRVLGGGEILDDVLCRSYLGWRKIFFPQVRAEQICTMRNASSAQPNSTTKSRQTRGCARARIQGEAVKIAHFWLIDGNTLQPPVYYSSIVT